MTGRLVLRCRMSTNSTWTAAGGLQTEDRAGDCGSIADSPSSTSRQQAALVVCGRDV